METVQTEHTVENNTMLTSLIMSSFINYGWLVSVFSNK
jgi:hypothetical protein